MDSSERRVSVLEMIIKTLRKAVSDLAERVGLRGTAAAKRERQRRHGASGGGVFKCNPSGSIAGATGTLGSQTCSSTTADVYQSPERSKRSSVRRDHDQLPRGGDGRGEIADGLAGWFGRFWRLLPELHLMAGLTYQDIGGDNCPCIVGFQVRRCLGVNVAGLTVSVYTSMGGTLLASGTTTTGVLILAIPSRRIILGHSDRPGREIQRLRPDARARVQRGRDAHPGSRQRLRLFPRM